MSLGLVELSASEVIGLKQRSSADTHVKTAKKELEACAAKHPGEEDAKCQSALNKFRRVMQDENQRALAEQNAEMTEGFASKACQQKESLSRSGCAVYKSEIEGFKERCVQ